MKQMKKFKKLTLLLTMILCIFSVMSFSSVKASAATNVAYAKNPYLRTYSNGCTEVYTTINYLSGGSINTSTNISWLVKSGASSNSIKMLQASLNRVMGTANSARPLLSVDGQWGPQTKEVLTTFQSIYIGRNYADGICGPQTWRTLVKEIQALER